MSPHALAQLVCRPTQQARVRSCAGLGRRQSRRTTSELGQPELLIVIAHPDQNSTLCAPLARTKKCAPFAIPCLSTTSRLRVCRTSLRWICEPTVHIGSLGTMVAELNNRRASQAGRVCCKTCNPDPTHAEPTPKIASGTGHAVRDTARHKFQPPELGAPRRFAQELYAPLAGILPETTTLTLQRAPQIDCKGGPVCEIFMPQKFMAKTTRHVSDSRDLAAIAIQFPRSKMRGRSQL